MISYNIVIVMKVQRLAERRTLNKIMEMGNNLKKYIVYLTTNKINNKIYIGVHETNSDVFDNYLGCGAFIDKPSSYNKGKTHLHNAILKYGISAFYRTTLKTFNTLQDALDLEAFLVNEEFIKRTDTYNMTCGGSIPPINNKNIYQFNLQGNLIKEWDSIKEITKYYKCNKDRITMCIKDKRSFNGYWSYENNIKVNEYRLSTREHIFQYNKDGILLNNFENATRASIELDIDRQAIINSVYNRTTCFGYYFLKEDENIENLLNEKKNKINIHNTSVYRYNLNGTFNKEYSSIKLAINDTPKTSNGNIIRAIKNNRTCGGYKWSYDKYDNIQEFSGIKPVKIAQYDLNHKLIKIWDSVTECKKEFPSCQKVCRKERKSTKEYIFEYIS